MPNRTETASEAPAPTASTPTPRREDTGPTVVKYTGAAGIREITKAQWKGAGIENQDTVVWDEANEYTLPIGDFTAEALEILKRDRNIKVS